MKENNKKYLFNYKNKYNNLKKTNINKNEKLINNDKQIINKNFNKQLKKNNYNNQFYFYNRNKYKQYLKSKKQNYGFKLTEDQIKLIKLNILQKYNLFNSFNFKNKEIFFIKKLYNIYLKKKNKKLKKKCLLKKKNINNIKKVKILTLDGKVKIKYKLNINNNVLFIKNKNKNKNIFINLLKKKKNFFFFIKKKKINVMQINFFFKNKINRFLFNLYKKKFKFKYKENNFIFNKKNKKIYEKKDILINKIINYIDMNKYSSYMEKKKKMENDVDSIIFKRTFYYKYANISKINFINYLKLKKIFFFFFKKKYIKENNLFSFFLVNTFKDKNRFILFPSFLEKYYYFGLSKRLIRFYKFNRNINLTFNELKKTRIFFFLSTNINSFFELNNDIFPFKWSLYKELSFFWRFFFFLITKWNIFLSYSFFSIYKKIKVNYNQLLNTIYINLNNIFFFEISNILYTKNVFDFNFFLKNSYLFIKAKRRKMQYDYDKIYPNLSYFLLENLLLKRKDGFVFLMFNKENQYNKHDFSFMYYFTNYFLYSVPKKYAFFNFFKIKIDEEDKYEKENNQLLNTSNQLLINKKNKYFYAKNINKKKENKIKQTLKKQELKEQKKDNKLDKQKENNISFEFLKENKLFLLKKKKLRNKFGLYITNIYNNSKLVNSVLKPQFNFFESEINNLLYLKQILLEMGVHLGTEINGNGRYKVGYNEAMNFYLLGFFKIRNIELVDYSLYKKKFSFFSSIFKKGFLFYQTLKYPIINIQSTMFVLKQAMNFIVSLGKKGGRILFFHSEIPKNPGFLLFLSGISNLFGHSFNYMPWIFGAGSNYSHMMRYFFDNFFYHGSIIRNKIKGTSFISFFFRVLFLNCFLIPKDMSLIEFEKKMLLYWKMIIFFRYFSHYFWSPDVVIGLNPNGGYSAVSEYGSHRLASISAVDTDGTFKGISYAIPSNDDSLSIAAFYFNLFINAYEKGRLTRYHYNFSDTFI